MTQPISRRGLLTSTAGAAAAATMLPGLTSTAHAAAHAPSIAASQPTHYGFNLGVFECSTILDGAIQLDGPHPIFGQDQEASAVQALARENFLPETKMEIGFTPFLVKAGDDLVLFDTGNGAGRRPNAGNLRAQLQAGGVDPSAVSVVVITHFHPDHIGGLMEEGSPAYPNARYVTGEAEFDFWTAEDRMSGPTEGVAKLTAANVKPLAEKFSFIKDGAEVVSGITAINAFGHTPGHMAFNIESDGKRILLWADAANHYVHSVQRPDWHVRFDMDKDAAAATRKTLFDMAAADRIPVTGYHMPFPAVGYIDKKADDYRWVPASYQLKV